MRWRKLTRAEKDAELEQWHTWFVWFPTRIDDHIVWFEWVARKGSVMDMYESGRMWSWQYSMSQGAPTEPVAPDKPEPEPPLIDESAQAMADGLATQLEDSP